MSPQARSKQHHRLWRRTYQRKWRRQGKRLHAFADECRRFIADWRRMHTQEAQTEK